MQFVFIFFASTFSNWVFVKNSFQQFSRGLFIPPLTHMKMDGQSDSFSPSCSSLVGWHQPTSVPCLLTYCITRTQSVILCPSLPFFSVCLSPVASYLEVMTSIRFNMKGEGTLWIEMEEEICRWASVKCLHMPGSECLWGERSGHLEGSKAARVCFDSSSQSDNGAQTFPWDGMDDQNCRRTPFGLCLWVILSCTLQILV